MIKKLKPNNRNGVLVNYPNNEKLMNKVNELIDIIEAQQKEINELKLKKMDDPHFYD